MAILTVFLLHIIFDLLGECINCAFTKTVRLQVVGPWQFQKSLFFLGLLLLLLALTNLIGIPIRQSGPIILGVGISLLLFLLTKFTNVRKCAWIRFKNSIAPLASVYLLLASPFIIGKCNWQGFFNDDMANYCMVAERHLKYGFFERPNSNLFNLTDYCQFGWFMTVPGSVRFGSELLIAFVSSISGQEVEHCAMPTLILLLTLLSVGAIGLIYEISRNKLPKNFNFLWLLPAIVAFPVLIFSYTSQLIDQTTGLVFLLGTANFLSRNRSIGIANRNLAKNLFTTSLYLYCIFISYPEMTPFLIGGLFIYLIAQLKKPITTFKSRFLLLAKRIKFLSLALILSMLTLGPILPSVFSLLIFHIGFGAKENNGEVLFPVNLTPLVFPVSVGLHPGLIFRPPIALEQISIGIGAILLVACILTALRSIRSSVACCIFLIMIFLALKLFSSRSDYGLFKIFLYTAPFIVSLIASGIISLHYWRRVPAALISLALFSLYFAISYKTLTHSFSINNHPGGVGTINHGSLEKSEVTLKELCKTNSTNQFLLIDTPNAALAKYFSLKTSREFIPAGFPSNDFFSNIYNYASKTNANPFLLSSKSFSGEMIDLLQLGYKKYYFNANAFTLSKSPAWNSAHLPLQTLMTFPFENAFNRSHQLDTNPNSTIGLHGVRAGIPWIVFHTTQLGGHYLKSPGKSESFYLLESDFFNTSNSWSGFGQYSVISIINTVSDSISLRISLSTTTLPVSTLPMIKVYGFNGQNPYLAASCDLTQFIGASVIYLPIKTIGREEASPFIIDFGLPQSISNKPPQGLMRLFGSEINIDNRKVSTFVRDISAFDRLNHAPHNDVKTTWFKEQNLAHKKIFLRSFAGSTEDGWTGKKFKFEIERTQTSEDMPQSPTITSLKLEIPGDLFQNGQEISIIHEDDESLIANRILYPGINEIKIPVKSLPCRIAIHFKLLRQLPGERKFISSRLLQLSCEDDR